MAKSRQTLRARVTQATRRRRKEPTNPVQRAFDDLTQLVSDTGDRLFSQSSRRASKQASAKKAGARRIRAGQQRQKATKRAVRARRAKS